MSWKATAYIKEFTHDAEGKRLSRSEKLLLLVIADYYNDEAKAAWASVKRIAKDALMSERHARRLLDCLASKRKMLEVEHRRGKSSIYRFRETPATMSEVKPDVRTGADISGNGCGHSYVRGSADIQMSDEPSVEPSVLEPSIEPSVESTRARAADGIRSVGQVIESGGKKWEVITDQNGRESVRPIADRPERPTDETSTRPTGKFLRWTVTDDDDGSFNINQLLTVYNELTGNPQTKSDQEIAEIIGASFKFSSAASVALMREISRRAKGKINSLAYFRTGLRERQQACEMATLHAVTATGGTAEQKWRAEILAVRAEMEEWKKKGG